MYKYAHQLINFTIAFCFIHKTVYLDYTRLCLESILVWGIKHKSVFKTISQLQNQTIRWKRCPKRCALRTFIMQKSPISITYYLYSYYSYQFVISKYLIKSTNSSSRDQILGCMLKIIFGWQIIGQYWLQSRVVLLLKFCNFYLPLCRMIFFMKKKSIKILAS